MQDRRRQRILRINDVLGRLGISRSQLYRLIEGGSLPEPLSLGPRTNGWLESEIDAAIATFAAKRGIRNDP